MLHLIGITRRFKMADEPLIWDCEMEVNLFHALRGHKPVGVNKHFHMVTIYDKLASSYKKITSKQIWSYLGELYDLNALNESEIIPFPNKQNDFSLPDEYFELQGKSSTKSKHDGEKTESKSDKLNTSTKSEKSEVKSEKQEKTSDSGSSKSSKSESRHSLGSSNLNTPDNSPKRKRTRHTPSSTASPATPDAPPPKRRR